MILNIRDSSRKVYISESQCRLLVEDSRYSRCGFEMLVGIPGCGKSTYLRKVSNPNVLIVCPDDIRRELTGNISDQSRNGDVWAAADERISEGLKAGRYVILDATNVGTRNRVNMLNKVKGMNPGIGCYATVFDCNPDVSKERISRDIENGVDRSNVPTFVIDRMYSQYLETLEVIKDEGFDDVFYYGGSNEGRLLGEAKTPPPLHWFVGNVYDGKYDMNIYEKMRMRDSSRHLAKYVNWFPLSDEDKQSLYDCMVTRYEYLLTCIANTAQVGMSIMGGMFDDDIANKDYSWFEQAAESEPLDKNFIKKYIEKRIEIGKRRKLFRGLPWCISWNTGSYGPLGHLPLSLMGILRKKR